MTCSKNKLTMILAGLLFASLVALLTSPAMGAVIVSVNPYDGIIYVDLQANERASYAKGDPIVFYQMPERAKYPGKIIDIVQSRRLVIEVEGGAYYMRLGAVIQLVKKQSYKKVGRKLSILNRSDELYQKRRNPSICGGVAVAGDKVGLTNSFLLYGGSFGLSMPWDTEVEGHFWMGSTTEVKIDAEMTLITGQVKKFIGDTGYVFVGMGQRSVTISLKAKKKTEEKDAAAGLVQNLQGTETGEEEAPVSSASSQNYSDDLVSEVGAGLRAQVPTFVVGKSMILGADVGAWYLLKILDTTQENLELDLLMPLPYMTLFARAYAGFSF